MVRAPSLPTDEAHGSEAAARSEPVDKSPIERRADAPRAGRGTSAILPPLPGW